MAALILLILFGLGFALFATQNTGSVHILLGSYIFNNIPLYVVVIGSILLGVFISWLINLVEEFSLFFTLQMKDNMLKKSQQTIEELQRENSELKLKVTQLTDGESTLDEEEVTKRPSLIYRLKKSLNMPSMSLHKT